MTRMASREGSAENGTSTDPKRLPPNLYMLLALAPIALALLTLVGLLLFHALK